MAGLKSVRDFFFENQRLNVVMRFLAEFTNRISALITFPLLARYLGTEGYGVQSQVNTIIAILLSITSLGLGFSVVRMVAGKNDIAYISQRFFATTLVVFVSSVTVAAVMISFASTINSLFFKVAWATPIIQISALNIIFMTLEQTIKEYYRARLRLSAYSLFQIAETLIYVGSVVILLVSGRGLYEIILVNLIARAIVVAGLYGYFLKVGDIEFGHGLMSKEDLKAILIFGLPVMASAVSTSVISIGDRTVIGYYLTAHDVGVYNAAYSFATLLSAMASPFWSQLYPLMAANINQNDRPGLLKVSKRYTNVYLILSTPALVGLIVISPVLLQTLGSADFYVSRITFGLIAAGIFLSMYNIIPLYLTYLHNEPTFLLVVTVLSALVNTGLNLLLIPKVGIFGAALSTLGSYALMTLLLLLRMHTYGYKDNEVYDLSSLLRYFLSALVMGGVVFTVLSPTDLTLFNLLRAISAGVVAYAIAIWTAHGFKIQRVVADF